MKLKDAINHLQEILRQKPDADFDFVFNETGYGFEVRKILYEPNNNRGIVIITDQEEED